MALFSFIISTLPFAGGAVTVFGLSPALSSSLISIGKGLLYQAASNALRPGIKLPRQDAQATLNQSTAPRKRGYGLALLGGTRALWESSGGNLYQIVMAHEGPIHSVQGFLIDGDPANIDANGKADGWNGRIHIYSREGAANGGGYQEIRDKFNFWGADHRLEGMATFMTRFQQPKPENFNKVYPRGAQTSVQMIAELSEVYDPRTGQTGFSKNPALCIRDYLLHRDGWRIPASMVDDDSFGAFADICDEPMVRRYGPPEPRYQLCGVYSLEDAPKAVLQSMLDTCNANLYLTTGGRLGITGGILSEPDFTLIDDHILSSEVEYGADPFKKFNVLKGIYTSPDHKFTDQECQEWRDEAALQIEPEEPDTFEVPFCPSPSQMQRLLQIRRAITQPAQVGTVTTNLVGLKARFPKGNGVHTIRIQSEKFGLDGVFLVTSHDYSVADGSCTIGVQSVWDGWAWDYLTQEAPPPKPLEDIGRPDSAPTTPTGLTVAQRVVSLNADTNAAQIVATVDDPGRDDLQLIAEYRQIPNGDWVSMSVTSGGLRASSDVVADGHDYLIRAYWLGQGADESDYPSQSIRAVSNPTVPPHPDNVVVSAAAGLVSLSWTNAESQFYRTRVYRSTTASLSGATISGTIAGVAGQPGGMSDQPSAGTYYYWFVTVNASQIESDPVGPISITV